MRCVVPAPSPLPFFSPAHTQDDPEACSVVAQLVEKPWYNAHAATYVQSGETTMELGLGLRNLTGRAEHISGSLEYGWNTSSTFALGWSQPMFMGLPVLVSCAPTHPVTASTDSVTATAATAARPAGVCMHACMPARMSFTPRPRRVAAECASRQRAHHVLTRDP